MSGYLQRLARAVTQPAETLHPLLGSVFSPTHYPKASDGFEPDVVSASSSEAAPAPERSQEAHGLRALESPLLPSVETTIPISVVSAEELAPPPAIAREIASFQPLLMPARNEDSKTAERNPEADTATESGKPEEPRGLEYTPVLTQALVHARHPDISVPKPNPAGVARHGRDSSRRAEGESDEIQIHIGRIEVTVVQQTPARAPLKPLHKGKSLEEYLKLRDRRA
jgi:hypothetical protein